MSSEPRYITRMLVLGLVLLVVLTGGIAYWWFTRDTGPDPARSRPGGTPLSGALLEEILRLNNKGVGLMEQFGDASSRQKSVEIFEEVVEKAPDWLPGRINLGIALFNRDQRKETLDRGVAVLEDVLRRDPDNPYGHYCLGVIWLYRNQHERAAKYFEKVTQLDPTDACAWYYRGYATSVTDPDRGPEFYRKAIACDPHHQSALYGLALHLRATNLDKAKEMLARHSKLGNKGVQWEQLVSDSYTYSEVGKYAQLITPLRSSTPRPAPRLPMFLPDEHFKVPLASKARWATQEDLGKGVVGELRRKIRARFGGTLVGLDYDRDDRMDLLVVGAVVEEGQVRNLLLHNKGNGHFVDVTASAGLAAPHATLGCSVADFDNDRYPDLVLTGAGSQRLLRNTGKGSFEDVTARAGLDQLKSVCLGSSFVDLDQDGDLDLLLAQYAVDSAKALVQLEGKRSDGGGTLLVYLNVGEAPPHSPNENQPPLKCAWKRITPEVIKGWKSITGPVTGLAMSDLEWDRDLDLVILADRKPLRVALNDRLLHFRQQMLGENLTAPSAWNGALVFGANQDVRSDLLLLAQGKSPSLLLNNSLDPRKPVADWFQAGEVDARPLVQAQAVDVDLDGWTDIVGVAEAGFPVLLHNDNGKLTQLPAGLGRKDDWPDDILAVLALDSRGKPTARDSSECGAVPDLLAWSESKGLLLRRNQGNGLHALQLWLTGQIKVEPSGSKDRSNADGLGTWVVARAAGHWAGQENTTLFAGLGQSRLPLLLGLGQHGRADVLRLRWPDGVIQAQLDVPCGLRPPVIETNRKTDSCPILFTHNGERYIFLTDFLGAGTMGEMNPDGTCRPPRPEESVKIEAHQLKPVGGYYKLVVAEPMDEISYLDRLQLVVLDHPKGAHVYPDERLATVDPQPTQELISFTERIFPRAVRDHRGKDMLETLRKRDRQTVDGFAHRSWLGFAEEHWVELDLGDQLRDLQPTDRLVLCLAGWTDYAYPRSIWAARQAGVAMIPPTLEQRGKDGKWHKVAEVGFPAGLPRMMTFEVTGKMGGPDCKLRLRTNLRVYWDQIYLAVRCASVSSEKREKDQQRRENKQPHKVRAHVVEVADARLQPCGIMQEYTPDGKLPTLYAYDRQAAVPTYRLAGNMTRYGAVTELLRRRDDCFVIFGAGDKVSVRFDARTLPPLPAGWQRSFVLRSWGYCKGAGPFTATGSTVKPLPFHGMSRYPYGPKEHYPDTPQHRAYQRKYNTRVVRPEVGR